MEAQKTKNEDLLIQNERLKNDLELYNNKLKKEPEEGLTTEHEPNKWSHLNDEFNLIKGKIQLIENATKNIMR